MLTRPRLALVADDTSLVRWAITEALTAEGFEVHSAGTRAETLGQLIGSGFDLVVVSLAIAREDVYDLVCEVRRRRPETRLVLLVDPDERAVPCSECSRGAMTLEKPFNLDELLAAVRTLTQAPTAAPQAGSHTDGVSSAGSG